MKGSKKERSMEKWNCVKKEKRTRYITAKSNEQRNVSENGRCDIIKKVQRGGWFGRNSKHLPA